MNNHSLLIIDPAIVNPSVESFNRISKIAPISVTYHLPALFGTYSLLEEYNKNTKGIIILGSAASVNEEHKWQYDIEKIILDASEFDIPIMGLCYGHQLIGKIFGGKVEPLWNKKTKRGNRKVQLKESSMWGKPRFGSLIYSHQDGITKVPPGFNVIASSKMVSVEAIQSKDKPIWGFQAHLEATEAFMIENKLEMKNIKNSFTFGHNLLDTFIMSLK